MKKYICAILCVLVISLSAQNEEKSSSLPCQEFESYKLGFMDLANQIKHVLPSTDTTYLKAWAFDSEFKRAVTYVTDPSESKKEILLWDVKKRCVVRKIQTGYFANSESDGDDWSDDEKDDNDSYILTSVSEIKFEGNKNDKVIISTSTEDFTFDFITGKLLKEIENPHLYDFFKKAPIVIQAKGGNAKIKATLYKSDNSIVVKLDEEEKIINDDKLSSIDFKDLTFGFENKILIGVFSDPGQTDGRGLIFFDIELGRQVYKIDFPHQDILDIQYDENNNILITVHKNGAINIWNIQDVLKIKPGEETKSKQSLVLQSGHIGNINAIDFSPDGKKMVSVGNDNKILIWDLATNLHFKPLPVNADLKDVQFTKDGKEIMVKSLSGLYPEVQIWNAQQGRLIKKIDEFTSLYKFNSKCNLLVSQPLSTYDGPEEPDLQIKDISSLQVIGTIKLPKSDGRFFEILDISNNGKYVAIKQTNSLNKTDILIYGEEEFKLLKKIKSVGDYIICGKMTDDGKHLVIGSGSGMIKVFKISNGNLLTEFHIGNWYQSLEYNKFGKRDWQSKFDFDSKEKTNVNTIAIQDNKIFAGGDIGNIGVWDLITGERLYYLIHDDAPPSWVIDNPSYGWNPDYNPIRDLKISTDGKFLASASARRSIQLWETKNFQPIKLLKTNLSIPGNVFCHPTENIVFTTNNNKTELKGFEFITGSAEIQPDSTVKLWSFDEGIKMTPFIGHKFDVNRLDISGDGKTLASIDALEFLILWDWEKQSIKKQFRISSKGKIKISYSGRYIGFVDSKENYGWSGVNIFDTETSRLIFQDSLKESSLLSFDFLSDDLFLYANGKEIRSVEIKKGKSNKWANYEHRSEILIDVCSKTKDVLIVNYSDVKLFDEKRKEPKWDYHNEFGISCATIQAEGKYAAIAEGDISSNQFYYRINILDLNSKKVLRQIKAHQATIRSLSFHANGKWLLSSSEDGIIAVWDFKTGEKLFNLNASNEGFIAFQPDSYYYSSKDVNQLVGFQSNENVYGFEHFDLKYNRPSKVIQTIGYSSDSLIQSFEQAFQTRLRKMNRTPEMLQDAFHLPKIEIVSKDIPLQTNQSNLEFEITASDSKHSIVQLNVYVNQVPIYGESGIKISKSNQKKWTEKIKLSLSIGVNKIQVSAVNANGTESLLETFQVNYIGKKELSDLYVITIGVSDYLQKGKNLKYPKKDAEDVNQIFQTQKESYDSIYFISVAEKDFNNKMLSQLKMRLQKTSIDDAVVIFYAGHGLVDEDFEYYLSTYHSDFDQPKKGSILFADFEKILEKIPARKKILLVDACNSGEIDKEGIESTKLENTTFMENIIFRRTDLPEKSPQIGLQKSFDLMQNLFIDLRRGTGATVISSASGVEFAYEGDEWKNGVFTFSFIKGLKEMEADRNDDGLITVDELKKYLPKKVSQLTKGHQRPTSRLNDVSNNFVIWYGKTKEERHFDILTAKGDFESSESASITINDVFFKERNYQKVIDLATKAIIKYPLPEFYNYRGMSYQNLNRMEEALADYSIAIQMDNKNEIYLINRIIVHSIVENPNQALKEIDELLEIYPESDKGYLLKCFNYVTLKDKDSALQVFEKLKSISKDTELIKKYEKQLNLAIEEMEKKN